MTKTPVFLFADIETIPSQDPVILAEIESRFPLPVLDLGGIKADGRLKDAEKIEADIAAKKEKAVADHAAALEKRLAAIDEAYRKTALDGSVGHLASIAWAFDEAEVKFTSNAACNPLESVWDDEAGEDVDVAGQGLTLFDPAVQSAHCLEDVTTSEGCLLTRFFRDLELSLETFARGAAHAAWEAANPRQLEDGRWHLDATPDRAYVQIVVDKADWIARRTHIQPPILVAHYADFDIRFIWQRAVALGVPVPAWWPVNASKYASDRVQDTMIQWAGHSGRIGLDRLCRALGVAGKTDMDGSMVWDAVKAGRIAEVVEYNRGDVRRLRSVHRRMRGLPVLAGDVDLQVNQNLSSPITDEKMIDGAWAKIQAAANGAGTYVSPDAFEFDEASGEIRVGSASVKLTMTEKTS